MQTRMGSKCRLIGLKMILTMATTKVSAYMRACVPYFAYRVHVGSEMTMSDANDSGLVSTEEGMQLTKVSLVHRSIVDFSPSSTAFSFLSPACQQCHRNAPSCPIARVPSKRPLSNTFPYCSSLCELCTTLHIPNRSPSHTLFPQPAVKPHVHTSSESHPS